MGSWWEYVRGSRGNREGKIVLGKKVEKEHNQARVVPGGWEDPVPWGGPAGVFAPKGKKVSIAKKGGKKLFNRKKKKPGEPRVMPARGGRSTKRLLIPLVDGSSN